MQRQQQDSEDVGLRSSVYLLGLGQTLCRCLHQVASVLLEANTPSPEPLQNHQHACSQTHCQHLSNSLRDQPTALLPMNLDATSHSLFYHRVTPNSISYMSSHYRTLQQRSPLQPATCAPSPRSLSSPGLLLQSLPSRDQPLLLPQLPTRLLRRLLRPGERPEEGSEPQRPGSGTVRSFRTRYPTARADPDFSAVVLSVSCAWHAMGQAA